MKMLPEDLVIDDPQWILSQPSIWRYMRKFCTLYKFECNGVIYHIQRDSYQSNQDTLTKENAHEEAPNDIVQNDQDEPDDDGLVDILPKTSDSRQELQDPPQDSRQAEEAAEMFDKLNTDDTDQDRPPITASPAKQVDVITVTSKDSPQSSLGGINSNESPVIKSSDSNPTRKTNPAYIRHGDQTKNRPGEMSVKHKLYGDLEGVPSDSPDQSTPRSPANSTLNGRILDQNNPDELPVISRQVPSKSKKSVQFAQGPDPKSVGFRTSARPRGTPIPSVPSFRSSGEHSRLPPGHVPNTYVRTSNDLTSNNTSFKTYTTPPFTEPNNTRSQGPRTSAPTGGHGNGDDDDDDDDSHSDAGRPSNDNGGIPDPGYDDGDTSHHSSSRNYHGDSSGSHGGRRNDGGPDRYGNGGPGREAEVMDDMTAEDMEIVTMEDAVMTPATTVVDMAAAVVYIDVEDPEEAMMALEEEAEAADPEVDLRALLASFQALLKTSFEDRNGTCLPSRT